MALINCPACGKNISDKAVSCPGCGHPMQSATTPVSISAPKNGGYRAIAVVIVVAAVAVALCAIWALSDRQRNKSISDSIATTALHQAPPAFRKRAIPAHLRKQNRI